jgi:hypothetical protein
MWPIVARMADLPGQVSDLPHGDLFMPSPTIFLDANRFW